MKFLKTTKIFSFLLIGLIVVAASAVYGQNVNSGAPKYPFPHHVSYPHGTMLNPALTNSGSQAGLDSAVSQMYNSWYANFVTPAGANLRVQRDATNGHDTVSEGIGYGMLFAVQMADQTLFNGLYQYAKSYFDGHGLMNWTCPGGSGCNSNSATDADEDMCMALLMADAQWGSAGAINYKGEFQNMANNIYNYEIGATDFRVYSGDAYQYPYYSSYMEGAWYHCWASKDGVSSHNWNGVANWSYNNYFASLYAVNGLGFMPDTANPNGVNATQNTMSMGYDASRYPIR
ncbi:MAG TPA: glycosyl hydrolase family 8, partial [bacterium]